MSALRSRHRKEPSMPSPTDVIVHSLSGSQKLLNRYCEDLTPAEYLHRACGGSNCVAWTLGHLVISERSALGRVGMTDLPPLPEGFEKRFARDAGQHKRNRSATSRCSCRSSTSTANF